MSDTQSCVQASWRDDEDKCIFIILDTSAAPSQATEHGAGQPASQQLSTMAGDVNLFLNDPEERSTAEIEV